LLNFEPDSFLSPAGCRGFPDSIVVPFSLARRPKRIPYAFKCPQGKPKIEAAGSITSPGFLFGPCRPCVKLGV